MSDHNIQQNEVAGSQVESGVTLKSWHRPVISRIDIARTENGNLAANFDGDSFSTAS